MKFTVVAADGIMGVNGRFRQIDLSDLDAEIHAIQYDSVAGYGHIEYRTDGAGTRKPNANITSFAEYQRLLDRWVAAAPPEEVPEELKTLDMLRDEKNREINSARLEANRGTFQHDGLEFSCDELSRSDIDGINGRIANRGEFPEGWPGVWKSSDNQYYQITDVDGWKAFYDSMIAQGQANFIRSETLKFQLQQIMASEAMTEDEKREAIASISW
jgi:hypothetical protein